MITRRKTRQIFIGKVPVGGDAPISIQSMTTAPTRDTRLCLKEIKRLEKAGCEIVRLGIPDAESALAIKEIKRKTSIPLVADIHFDYRLALLSIESGIDALRINPGNLRNRENVKLVVTECKKKNIPIRIGVNSGSIDKTRFLHPTAEALVDSALGHICLLEAEEFFDIKVSLKSSDVATMIKAYRLFSNIRDYPLHLGVTEAGVYEQAVVKSSIGIGSLLLDGIGDTIRVSITGETVKEVEIARTILRSLGIRKEGIEIISCPTCVRKEFDVVKIAEEFSRKTRHIKKYVKVAIMGCAVNGPGEAREADLGVAAGKNEAVIFKKGKIVKRVSKENILAELINELNLFIKYKNNQKK